MRTAVLRQLSFWIGTAGLVAACGSSSSQHPALSVSGPQSQVFGGRQAKPGDEVSRSVLAVFFKNSAGQWSQCGGTLLSRRVVLTAAHCVPADVGGVKVMFLSADLKKSPGSLESIEQFRIHEKYTEVAATEKPNAYDVALLRLKEPAPRAMQVMRRPSPEKPPGESVPVWVAGFGAESYDYKTKAAIGGDQLEAARVRFRPSSVEGVLQLDQTQSTGVCVGDSGSPVFYRDADHAFVQIGLVTSVENPEGGDACRGFSNLASLSFLAGWIEKSVHNLEGADGAR